MALDVEKLVFQLEVRGVPPEQAKAIANASMENLRAGMSAASGRLEAEHKKFQQKLTAEEKKETEARIKETKRYMSAALASLRQQEIAANKSRNAFRAMLQEVKNVLHIHEMLSKTVGKTWRLAAELVKRYLDLAKEVEGAMRAAGMAEEADKIARGFREMKDTYRDFLLLLGQTGIFQASFGLIASYLNDIRTLMNSLDILSEKMRPFANVAARMGVPGASAFSAALDDYAMQGKLASAQRAYAAKLQAARDKYTPEFGPASPSAAQLFDANPDNKDKRRATRRSSDAAKLAQEARKRQADFIMGPMEAANNPRNITDAERYNLETSSDQQLLDLAGTALNKSADPLGGWKSQHEEALTFAQEWAGAMDALYVGMQENIAASLTNAVAGQKGFAASMREMTKSLALGFSQEAYMRMLRDIALAIDEPWAAALHLTGAAKWAALGTAAGLIARATSSGGGGAPGGATTSAPTVSRGGGGSRSVANAGGGDGGGSIIFNFGTVLGSKDDLGEVIHRAMEAYKSKTGRSMN